MNARLWRGDKQGMSDTKHPAALMIAAILRGGRVRGFKARPNASQTDGPAHRILATSGTEQELEDLNRIGNAGTPPWQAKAPSAHRSLPLGAST